MNKKLVKIEILGFIISCIIGTLLHFLYNWSGESKLVALFAPINESPWEHMKMLFFPFLAFTIFITIKLRQDKFNTLYSNYTAIVIGMIVTLCYFYTLNGMLGGNNEWVNLSSYFVGMAFAFIVSYFLINNSVGNGYPNTFGGIMLVVTCLVFFLFTFKPPLIPLFQDPINLTFGIK